MFKRVAALLAEHAQASDRGELPFHEAITDGALSES